MQTALDVLRAAERRLVELRALAEPLKDYPHNLVPSRVMPELVGRLRLETIHHLALAAGDEWLTFGPEVFGVEEPARKWWDVPVKPVLVETVDLRQNVYEQIAETLTVWADRMTTAADAIRRHAEAVKAEGR